MAKRITKPTVKRAATKRTPARQRIGAISSSALAITLPPTGREQALSKPQIISELSKSPHGDLAEYVPVGLKSAKEDPDFFAHLIAWDAKRGQVRDAKVALPVIALAARPTDPDYVENAIAHLANLDPRMFVRALDFAKAVKAPSRLTRRLVKRYLRDLEGDKRDWERAAVQHRASLIELYSRFSVKPADFADQALFKHLPGMTRLDVVRGLYNLPATDAAVLIARHRIPFLIARGALKEKAKSPDMLLALINNMSPTELVTNTKMLQKWGVMDQGATRAAFEEALKRAAESKQSTLKTSTAATVMAEAGHTKIAEKLQATQEKQLDKLKGVDGDWLVLADVSGSMETAIEVGRQITAILARMVKGKVHLVFFNQLPRYYDATGQTLEGLTALTKGVVAGGGTDIGCGVRYAIERKLHVDGMVIVSDGADHAYGNNRFGPSYEKYTKAMGTEPTVYFYQLPGEPDSLSEDCRTSGIDLQTFDLRKGKVDYYSLPNLVQTMRVGRYSLLDEVLESELKKLDQVLLRTKGQGVITNGTTVPATV